MRNHTADRAQPDNWHQEGLLLAAIASVAMLVFGGWAAMWAGGRIIGQPVPTNAVVAMAGLVTGAVPWPGLAADFVAAAEIAILGLTGWVVWKWRHPTTRTRTSADPLARHLARARDLGPYTAKGAAAKAVQLRPGGVGRHPGEHGVFLGETLTYPITDAMASWEDTIVLLAGPRIGKTSAFVIRQLIEAPGPALVTTVRRDVWDATAGVRAHRGALWNFDLQARVTDGVAPWWVDLLAGVRDIDEAGRLAAHFAAGTRDTTTDTRNGYFESEGEWLVSAFLLAAALKPDHAGTLRDVYRWLMDPKLREASDALRAAGHEFVADGVDALRTLPADEQQAGVFGFARSLVSCLQNPRVLRWVAPDLDADGNRADNRPQFSPTQFVAGRDTLYLHSKKGSRVAPLVAALTQAVLDAGEQRAQRSPAGRLDPPMLSILDEAANICKLRDLPDDYSHFGGSGLPVLTVLQSFEQGAEVWGRGGMKKLWGAATVRLYGGGSADSEFLEMLSKLLGPRDRTVTSTSSTGHGGTTTSYNTRRDNIAEVADLGALPPGRAVLFPAGARPTLIETVPWRKTPWAPRIQASIDAYGNTALTPHTGAELNPADNTCGGAA